MKSFVFLLCVLYFMVKPSNAVKFRKDLKVFMRYNVKVNMFPPDTIFAYADGFRLNWDIVPKKLMRRRRDVFASGLSLGRRANESETSPAAGGRNSDITRHHSKNSENAIVSGRNLYSSETALGRSSPAKVPNSDTSGISFSDKVPNSDTSGISFSDKVPNADTSGISFSDKVPNSDTSGISFSDQVPNSDSSSDGTEDYEDKDVFSKSNFVSSLEGLFHLHGWNGSACLERARCEAELLAQPHDIVTHLYLTLFRQGSSATDDTTCERNTLPCPVSMLHLMTSLPDMRPETF